MSVLKNSKRLFAFLLVFTLVAGLVGTSMPTVAYAKTKADSENNIDVKKLISDIDDANAKEAVLRLAAFDIINGKEDGKYHPEEMVTREEFAKILVTALKMQTAAQAGIGYASFKDVEPTRWSAGYIGIAAGHGLIKGYPDGTFKPANQVSYAEAATMLVRALGYKDEFLAGSWPGNYLAKAAEKEITKKVKFSDALGFANRGDVAILVNNALDAEVVKVDTYEGNVIKYKEDEKTLLEDKHNVTKLEDARIIANKRIDDGLDEDEVTVREYDKKKKSEYDDKDYVFVKNVNPEPFLGEEVTVYLDDDDDIVYIEREKDDKAYFDYVKEAKIKGSRVSGLDLVAADDDYEFDDDAVIYTLNKDDKYTRAKINEDGYLRDLDAKTFEGKVGKFVLKNRKIIYAEVMNMDEAYPWFIVMKNDKGYLEGICEDDDEFTIDLTKDGNYDGVIVLDLEGNTVDVEDIEEGNLLYVQLQSYDGDDYAVVRVVTNNILTGKLDRVKDKKVKIGSVERNVVNFGGDFFAYYSIDDGDEIKHFKDTDFIDDMDDADDKEMIAYTDAVGRIAYFVTEAKASSGYKYGIVTRMYSDYDRVKIYTISPDGEGDEIVYRVEEENNFKPAEDGKKYGAELLDEYGRKVKDKAEVTKASIVEGSVVKFKLNKDGEIAEDKIYVHDPMNLWNTDRNDDFGKDYLPRAIRYSGYASDDEDKLGTGANLGLAEGATASNRMAFSVEDNLVVISAEGYKFDEKLKVDLGDTGDYSETKWKDLSKSNGINSFFYIFTDDENSVNAKAVVFIGDGSGAASNDEMAIYAISKSYKRGDTLIKYLEYGSDKVEERVIDKYYGDSDEQKAKHERPYIAKIKSNGKIDLVAPKDGMETDDGFAVLYGKIKTKKSDRVVFESVYSEHNQDKNFSQKEFSISNKTLVYEEDTKKQTSYLKDGDVVLFVTEHGNIRVIEVLLDGERADALKFLGLKVEDDDDRYYDEDITVKVVDDSMTVTVQGIRRADFVEVYDMDDYYLGGGSLTDNKVTFKLRADHTARVKVKVLDKDDSKLVEETVRVK